MTNPAIAAYPHEPLNSTNFQQIHDELVKDAAASPQDQRLQDRKHAFFAFHVHSADYERARSLTQLTSISHEQAQHDSVRESIRNLVLLAEAKIVRDWITRNPGKADNQTGKKEFEQLTLYDTSIPELLQSLNREFPRDRDVKENYKDQLDRFYDGNIAQNAILLEKTEVFKEALKQCLVDAHVHPDVAEKLTDAVVRQNYAEKVSGALPTFRVLPSTGGNNGKVREMTKSTTASKTAS